MDDKQRELARNRQRKHRAELSVKEKFSINQSQLSSEMKLRNSILDLLGRKCIRCGFDDLRALQIDHINGGGTKERKELGNQYNRYRHILKMKGEGYQILCANCNRIKVHENHECRKRDTA